MPNYNPNPGQKKLRKLLKDPTLTRVLAYSGSRSGKTFELCRAIVVRALSTPDSRHVIIRKNFSQAKKFIWLDTLPEVINICFPEAKKAINWNKSDFYLEFQNGSEIWLGGLDDKERADRILGGEYNTEYHNECSEISYDSILTALTRLAKKSEKFDGNPLINKAYFDCNPPSMGHWSYKWFFMGIDPESRAELGENNFAKVYLRPEDNAENLPDGYIDELKKLPGDKRKRFYDGEYQEEVKGALWSQSLINQYRVTKHPPLQRIVIPIDPAVTKKETSDETGIIPCGLGTDNQGYVLDDISGHYSPNEWADIAINAYMKWQADAIVCEVNNGGDLVAQNIRYKRPDIRIVEVHASRGKIVRAEPVAGLYEQGLIHHVGEFPDLEYQMTSYTGHDKDDSPDRMDALVYGLTELANPPEIEDIVHDDERVTISPY